MSRVAKPRTARPTKPGRKPRKKKTPPPPPLHARWLARITRFARIPSAVYLSVALLLSLVLVPGVNWLYQVVRKPSELFFPVSDDLYKTPTETWASYGPLFLAHSTSIMTPELLAALAQKEASGNPVARTYWRWSTTLNLFEIYRPASSAVGMYQFTDGTFEEAKRYCIHDHRVVADGPVARHAQLLVQQSLCTRHPFPRGGTGGLESRSSRARDSGASSTSARRVCGSSRNSPSSPTCAALARRRAMRRRGYASPAASAVAITTRASTSNASWA